MAKTNKPSKNADSDQPDDGTDSPDFEPRRMEMPRVLKGADIKKCPSCGSTDIIFDNEKGEYVCNNCGLIIEENVTDSGPEWRAFDADQRNARARTGAPIKYMKPNKGLVTEIDMYNKDIRGTKLPSKRQAQLYRMRKWHKRASIASSSERNYLIALPELNRVASYLGLPDNIREQAALLYRQCVKNNLIRGRPIETVVNAALYATCRDAGMPRTLDEIAQVSGTMSMKNTIIIAIVRVLLCPSSFLIPFFIPRAVDIS